MRKFLSLGLFIISAIVLFFSCRRTDLQNETPKPDEQFNRFFNVPATSSSQAKAIAEAVKKQNEKHKFLTNVIKNAGYPRWDKAKIVNTNRRSVTGRNSSEGEEQVYIPLVRDHQNQVGAILAVQIFGRDSIYRLLYDSRYKFFGYDTTGTTQWSARNVFLLFALFDNTVFGHTKFLITDDRMFQPRTDSTQVVLTLNPETRTTARIADMAVPITECAEFTHCDIVLYPDKAARTTGESECYTVEYCVTFWYTFGGGGGGDDDGWVGTGDGTGGGGSGGGGGNGWFSGDPCSASVMRTSVIDPDDECSTGWESDPISPSSNADGVESICNKSFKFKKIIEATNGVGGWQIAGVKNVHMNIMDLVSRKLVLLRLPVIYFGLPVIRSNGDFYSTSTAAGIASDAVEYAEQRVMDYYHSLGGSLDVVGMSLYYRNKINEYMQNRGGSVGLTPGSNINNVEITEAVYSGILGLNCL